MDNINNNLNNLIKILKILIFTMLISLIIFFNTNFVYAITNVKLISLELTGNKSINTINTTINNPKTTVPHLNLNKRLYSVNDFKKHKKQYKAILKKCKTLNYQTASLTARNNCSKATMLKFFNVIKIKKK